MLYKLRQLQPFTEIIETNAKNGVVPISHKQCKTLFNDHTVRLKIISLYIYKDLRLIRILGLMSHVTIIHKDGNLVPSTQRGFSFEAVFQL